MKNWQRQQQKIKRASPHKLEWPILNDPFGRTFTVWVNCKFCCFGIGDLLWFNVNVFVHRFWVSFLFWRLDAYIDWSNGYKRVSNSMSMSLSFHSYYYYYYFVYFRLPRIVGISRKQQTNCFTNLRRCFFFSVPHHFLSFASSVCSVYINRLRKRFVFET